MALSIDYLVVASALEFAMLGQICPAVRLIKLTKTDEGWDLLIAVDRPIDEEQEEILIEIAGDAYGALQDDKEVELYGVAQSVRRPINPKLGVHEDTRDISDPDRLRGAVLYVRHRDI